MIKRFLFKRYRILRKIYLLWIDFLYYINNEKKPKNKIVQEINKWNKQYWDKNSIIYNGEVIMDEERKKQKQLEKNREELIRERTPIHSKVPTDKYYNNYDKIKWNHKKEK
jgi:hypothetical protein